MTLAEKQQQLTDDLGVIPDARERLSLVIERARHAASLPAADRVDANRVPGCVSPVWLVAHVENGRCRFQGDAEGALVKGLVVFLCEFFDGAAPAEIIESGTNPLEALELIRGMSPTRQNGLNSVLAAIRNFAQRAVAP